MAKRKTGSAAAVIVSLACILTLSGCTSRSAVNAPAASTSNDPSLSPAATATSIMVQSGNQPIAGASIQLYAIGANGDPSTASPLLTAPVTSQPNGSSSISGLYQCPSASSLVYLTAVGGNTGTTWGTSNPQSVLVAALGSCGDLNANTSISVNEVTTVAAAAALAQYIPSRNGAGSQAVDLEGLAAGFAVASELANPATGTSPGTDIPAGDVVPSQKLNSLANILSTCVHSAGGVAGDGSPCGKLFSLAAAADGSFPTETVDALLNIVRNPASNVASLYDLSPPTALFLPPLASAPSDWRLEITPATPVPVLTPASGTITASTMISLADSDPNAVMYYSTDGSVPTSASNRYNGAFSLSQTSTVRAVAIAGGVSSLLAAGTYVVTSNPAPAPPVLDLAFVVQPSSVTNWHADQPHLCRSR